MIIKIFGKKYKWNVDEMHPVAFWGMVISLMTMSIIGMWCMVSLSVVMWG